MPKKKIGLRLSIRLALILSFGTLILSFVGNYFYTRSQIIKSEEITNYITQVSYPSQKILSDFGLEVSKATTNIQAWTQIEVNDATEKTNLRKFIGDEKTQGTYDKFKKRIDSLANNWQNAEAEILADSSVSLKGLMDSTMALMDSTLKDYKFVMSTYNSFDSYAFYNDPSNFMFKIEVDGKVEDIKNAAKIISDNLNQIKEEIQNLTKDDEDDMRASFSKLLGSSTAIAIAITIFGIIVALLFYNIVVRPVNRVKNVIFDMSKGKIPDVNLKKKGNEIGDMIGALEILTDGLKETSDFASDIGEGQLDAEFTPLSEEDVLGNALVTMRANLKQAQEDEETRKHEDERRNWVTTGIAQMGEILRDNNDNLEALSYEIISNSIKFMNANQGGIFIVNEDESGENTLQLTAAYAYERRKYMEKSIRKGEGLVGQCWQEGERIYITDVPENYVNITSGLGEALPRCIMIMPLMVNDEIYGIMEIASFNTLDKYEVQYLERISESIASTISAVKVNVRTAKLLEEAQEMSEQLQSQEEELRQNQEEMMATQEEMSRRIGELEQELEENKNKG